MVRIIGYRGMVMIRTLLVACVLAALSLHAGAADSIPSTLTPTVIVSTETEPIAPGPFAPSWQSLESYEVPAWFRDAKFGIWAHWGPQCEPERGDWYARHMYVPGHWQYDDHQRQYGHPSEHGFKDVIHAWQAERWNPSELVRLYKRAGAEYFFAMANHHDNLDLWDSKHHEWNSARVGPKKDLIGGWADAARAEGLRFGVSIHAAHAWSWYEPSQGADSDGDRAGAPYDGQLTKADGKDKWWEGLDPQLLYAQRHQPAKDFMNAGSIHNRWNWGNGVTPPDQAYCQSFYDRTIDLINQADPDLVYFDDTALPLWPVSDAGLKIAAHHYNRRAKGADGKTDAVLFGKILDEQQRRCMVWDIERGQSSKIEPEPWQTDTCIGGWHYDRGVYDRNEYKSAATVVRTLIDVVSKNGSLLLNVPVRGDGTIDERERAVVEGIADWMAVNREAIIATRPWKVCGEGPQLEDSPPLTAQGFNEGKGKPFTADDIRYTQCDGVVYAFVMARPEGKVTLQSLAKNAGHFEGQIAKIEQIGHGDIEWVALESGVEISPAVEGLAADHPVVFRITPAE
jgi:alpha-L-fucosidase